MLDRHLGHRHVGDVFVAGGVGFARGFGLEMKCVGGAGRKRRQIIARHNVEHEQRGDALPVRRHLERLPALIGRADRADVLAAVGGEIFLSMAAAMAAQMFDHGRRQGTTIERVAAAVGNCLQGVGEQRLVVNIAGLNQRAAGAERSARNVVDENVGKFLLVVGNARRHGVTVAGQFDGRLQEPVEGQQKVRALKIQGQFDDEVGPAIRLCKFYEVLDVKHAKDTFGYGAPWLSVAVWGLLFPVLANIIKRKYGVNPDSAKQARERTRQALDFVAAEAGDSGYLVGDQFSVADLSCAALLMLAVDVGKWGGPPSSGTEKNQRWLQSWEDHAGAEWVREMYRRHRK